MKKPMSPPDIAQLVLEISDDNPQRLFEIFSEGRPVDAKGRYLHWDQMRHRTPPDGLTLNEWWAGTTASRASQARTLPFTGTDGNPFRFTNIDRIQELVHQIDQQVSGRIQTDEIVATVGSSDRYVVSSLEEAITSSLLEGAATTRRVAKELLRTGRAPRDSDERMVLNNFQAMLRVEELAGTCRAAHARSRPGATPHCHRRHARRSVRGGEAATARRGSGLCGMGRRDRAPTAASAPTPLPARATLRVRQWCGG